MSWCPNCEKDGIDCLCVFYNPDVIETKIYNINKIMLLYYDIIYSYDSPKQARYNYN